MKLHLEVVICDIEQVATSCKVVRSGRNGPFSGSLPVQVSLELLGGCRLRMLFVSRAET